MRLAPGFVCAFLALAAMAVLDGASWAAPAQEILAQVRSRQVLRVCIWPDYYGITYRDPRTGTLTGIDADLSAAFARDLGVRLMHVDSSFATLVDDLEGGRCDVGMFAIGRLPSRMARLDFTQPYLESDIYGVTTRAGRVVREWQDIDRPGVQVAVQAGTFMEPVMRERLKQATLVVVSPPRTREQELESGRVDVFMTDYPYSRRLLDNADWARLVAPPAPFHRLGYAYAVTKGQPEWLARVEAFVVAVKRDGRLDAAARRHGLGEIVVKP